MEHGRQSGEGAPPRWRLYGALGVAVWAIACAAIFFRKAHPTPPLVMAGIRLAFASLVLVPVARWHRPAHHVSRRVFRAALVCGVLYGVHFGAWVTSLTLTSVASSVTLVTATPLILALHGMWSGRDRPTQRLWWSLGLAFIGLLFIGGADLGHGGEALTGDLLALLGAAAMAAYLLVSRRLGDEMDLWWFAAVATASGAVLMLTTAACLGLSLAPPSIEAWGWIVAAALLPQLVGHTTLTWAVRHVSPTTVGLATVGEPVGAAALGWLVLGESVGLWAGVGCLVTLVAVVLALRP